MVGEKTDYGVNTEENVKRLEDYLENDSRRFPEGLRSESVSSDTLEALQNAERLVEEAKRIIAEAQRRVIFGKTVSEDLKIMNLNDEELEIKCIVAAKFDEANGRKVKTQLENVFLRENLKNQNPMNGEKNSECKKCSFKNSSSPERQIPKEIHSLHNIKLQRGPQIDIRNDLSLRKIETLEINPQIPSTRINSGIFKLCHNTRKVDWIDEPTSFIDTAVQTSLRDSSETTKFEDALSRSNCSDLDQNKIHESRGPSGGMKDGGTTGKIDDEGPEVIGHLRSMKKANKLGQKSFIEFLCEIKDPEDTGKSNISEDSHEKFKKISSIDLIHSLTPLNSSIVNLKTPETENLDELLTRIDKKLEFIKHRTDIFDELCKTNCGRVNNEDGNVEISGLMRKNSSEYDLEVILQPISRVSSSSSGMSEPLHPGRYSTPLNNWKIEGESSVKLQIDDTRTIVNSASAPVISNSKSIESNFIDGIVPMTRNILSYEKNEVFYDKRVHSSSSGEREESGENSKTVSLFPTYSSDKSDESHRSEFKSSRIDRGSKESGTESIHSKIEKINNIENKIMKEVVEEIPVDLILVTGGVDKEKNSENFSVISQENNQHISSGRDATSRDISKLSSGVLEESCHNGKNSLKSFHESGGEGERLRGCGDDFVGDEQMVPEENSSEKSINDKQSIPSSSSLSSDRTAQKNSHGDYSEGELFLPSSCTYSLGEVVISSHNGRGIISKICVNLSSESSKIQPPNHSPGELLDTDIDSNSSLTSRGQLA